MLYVGYARRRELAVYYRKLSYWQSVWREELSKLAKGPRRMPVTVLCQTETFASSSPRSSHKNLLRPPDESRRYMYKPGTAQHDTK